MTLRPKSDSKDLEWKFWKVLVRITGNYASKSEIAFWYTLDKKILKTYQYFKVWNKSKLKSLKSDFMLKSDSKDLEWKFPKLTC